MKYITEMPYLCPGGIESGCATEIFWNIIRYKEKAIPFLLEKLNDSTSTTASVSVFPYKYTVADVAYFALQEIIHGIPTADLIDNKFEKTDCTFCDYWTYLRADYKNRIRFQKAAKRWYKVNQSKLAWVKSNLFSSCACGTVHPNGGHYELMQ